MNSPVNSLSSFNQYDIVTFTAEDGRTLRGSALRYDPRSGVVVVKVMGPAFRWEGGPLGEYLDRKGNLVPGKVGHEDSLWFIPATKITAIQPKETRTGIRRSDAANAA